MPQSTAALLIEPLESVAVDIGALRLHIAGETWDMPGQLEAISNASPNNSASPSPSSPADFLQEDRLEHNRLALRARQLPSRRCELLDALNLLTHQIVVLGQDTLALIFAV